MISEKKGAAHIPSSAAGKRAESAKQSKQKRADTERILPSDLKAFPNNQRGFHSNVRGFYSTEGQANLRRR